MSHALIVGGTGMLRDVSIWLCQHHDIVSVIARNGSSLDELKKENSKINPLSLDYCNTRSLLKTLEFATKQHGPIQLVVSWIHDTAPDALSTISSVLEDSVLYHILGSSHSNPSEKNPIVNQGHKITYRRIVLGFVHNSNSSRWLSHAEISKGVIESIQRELAYSIIGTVRPWSMRP